MKPSRAYVFNGLSSSSIRSFLILLLFAGSLSTICTIVSADESLTGNGTLVPSDIEKTKADSSTTVKNELESFDMRNSKASLADATVDLVDDDASVESNTTETNPSTAEPTASASTTTSSMSSTMITSPTISSVGTSSIASVTITEPTPPTTLVSPISTITTSPTITTETVAEITMLTTSLETDPPESFTAKTSTEGTTGMPTGIVALVTMITFAIIAVLAYVGLIVWRRYLEYRYGNRELLVNDLEFDTNDLRHFEL